MYKQNPKTFTGDQPDTLVAVAEMTAEPAPAAPVDEAATLSEQDIATLAYQRWLERGCPQGSPEEDWFEAERELQSKNHSS